MENNKRIFRVRTASIIGSEHQRIQINNQDGFATGEVEIQNKRYLWGVICDGCSAGTRNEVGAALLSNYLCEEIPYLISAGSNIVDIPDKLFISGLGYLRSLAAHTAMSSFQKQVSFIENHLLCTVIGFITDYEGCVFFNAGDGVVLTNNDIYRIDQNNRPLYMAYHLLNKSVLNITEPIPFSFENNIFQASGLERFAICSDGIDESIASELWGHEHVLGLQRRLRVLRLQGVANFSDDCTVIAVEETKNKDS